MNRREEYEYPVQRRVNQEQPSTGKQVIFALAFLGFIIAIPTIAEKLRK
jgi:hypothetical protein